MFLILKSIPMVVIKVGEKESLAYLRSKQVFPTPDEVEDNDNKEENEK